MADTKPKTEEKTDVQALRNELRNLMLEVKTGEETDTSRIKKLKRQIARELTKQRQDK